MIFSELAASVQQHQFEDAKVFIYNHHTQQFEEVKWIVLGVNQHVIQLQSELIANDTSLAYHTCSDLAV